MNYKLQNFLYDNTNFEFVYIISMILLGTHWESILDKSLNPSNVQHYIMSLQIQLNHDLLESVLE